jgi:hypothetical protein
MLQWVEYVVGIVHFSPGDHFLVVLGDLLSFGGFALANKYPDTRFSRLGIVEIYIKIELF